MLTRQREVGEGGNAEGGGGGTKVLTRQREVCYNTLLHLTNMLSQHFSVKVC